MADKRLFVFVIVPFIEKFKNVYNVGIKLACEEIDLRCEKVDEQTFENHIVEQIYSNIRDANLIIADLTEHNPNVYYEVGYARALKKRIISISRDISSLPFDLRSYPALAYGNRNNPDQEVDYFALKNNLKEKIQSTINIPNQNLDENIPIVFTASRKIQGEQLDGLFTGCEEEIWCCGIHFQWSISDHEAIILKKMNSGVSVNYIVINPNDHSVVERTARMISVPEDELQRECEDGFKKLERLSRRATEIGCAQNLHIYTSNREPLGRYYLFDPQDRNGSVLFTPYAFELRSSHSPSYLYKASSEVSRSYIDSCLRLRDASREHRFE
jgi:hypothetical protein